MIDTEVSREAYVDYRETEIGSLPVNWDVVSVGAVTRITTGSRNTQDRVEDGCFPFFVRSATVERIGSYCYEGEAILTAGDGVGTGKIFHYIDGKFDCHQRVYMLTHFSPDLDGRYLFNVFSTRFYDRIVAMTAKSSVDSVRREMISDMLIPLPPLGEQRAIAEALGDVDALIAAQQKLLAKKRAIKTATMQRLLTGRQRLPGFGEGCGTKQTEIGVIPEDWTISTLGQLASAGPANGYSGPTSESGSGTLTLRLSATTSGRLLLNPETTKRLQEQIPATSDLYLRSGDLLVQRSNTLELVGTAAVFEGPTGTYIYPDLMARVRFDTIVTSKWVWHYLNSEVGRKILRGLAAGSTGTMPKLSGEALRTVQIVVPTMEEQRAIAQVLTDIDSEIAALEKRLTKTKAIKQGMMQELLTGRTRLV